MRVLKTIIPFFLISFVFCTGQKPSEEINVMTFNVRFDNPSDGVNAWPNRVSLVEAYMTDQMPDIVGVQESLHHQNLDLLKIMPGYAYVGTGRDDGMESGEFSPIFYRTDRFEKMQHGQFWLSQTPDVPGSIGWEAVLPRVVAWIQLKDRVNDREFFVFNTHFSHVSDLARRRSMEFMSEMMVEIAGQYPVIVTGDFNITKGAALYHDMVARFQDHNRLTNAQYISQMPVAGADDTFNAFRDDTQPRVIDYIFVDDHFEVVNFGVDRVKDGEIFISDHWPVWARIKFSHN